MALWSRPNGPQSIAASSSSQAGLNAQAVLAALVPGTLVLTGVTETVMPHPQNPAIAYTCALSPNEENEQVPWDLVVSGYITTTTTGSATLKLYAGTSLTVGSDTLLATSGAVAQNSSSAPFELHAHFIYDSVSGKMGGWYEGIVNNTLVARAAISATLSNIKDTANPVVSFLLSGTASAAAPGTPTTIVVRNFSCG